MATKPSVTSLFSGLLSPAEMRQFTKAQDIQMGQALAQAPAGRAGLIYAPGQVTAMGRLGRQIAGQDPRTVQERETAKNKAMFADIYKRAQTQFPTDRVKQLQFLATELANQGKVVEAEKARAMAQQAQEEIMTAKSAAPSAVREYEFYKNLPEEEQKKYLRLKRKGTQLKDLGDSVALVDTTTNEIIVKFPKGLAPKDQPEVKAAQTQATELAVEDVDIISNAPTQLDTYSDIISKVKELKKHPGREFATGKSAIVPLLPGTPAFDFNEKLETVKGSVFLEQFEKLKGGGQITEIEGQKAEQALAALERKQSEGQFEEQLNIVLEIFERGQKRLQEKYKIAQERTKTRSESDSEKKEPEERIVNWSDLPK